MPRKLTGTIKAHGDHFDARITLPDGTRPWIHLPASLTERQARARAASISKKARSGNAEQVKPPKHAKKAEGGASLETWTDAWLEARRARGLTSVDDDEGRLGKWVIPYLGADSAMAGIERRELEGLVEHLDASVTAGRLSWKTAKNTWGLVSKMFKDACSSKVRALRCREDNPAAGIVGPDRGVEKQKTYLWPSEFMQLVGCEALDLQWRRAIAIAVYLYPRAAEHRALRWKEDVDLAHAVVQVHRSVSRDEAKGKSTKTKRGRPVPIEPALMPLLEVMHREAGGEGVVIELPDDRHLSRALQGLLRKAGLTRPALFTDEPTRKRMTWHDLRATGITWRAVRGDEPLKIMHAAGHEDFETTQKYIREAEVIRDGFGTVFPRLPASLLVAGEGPASPPSENPEGPANRLSESSEEQKKREILVEAPGIETGSPAPIRTLPAGIWIVNPPRRSKTARRNPGLLRGLDDSRRFLATTPRRHRTLHPYHPPAHAATCSCTSPTTCAPPSPSATRRPRVWRTTRSRGSSDRALSAPPSWISPRIESGAADDLRAGARAARRAPRGGRLERKRPARVAPPGREQEREVFPWQKRYGANQRHASPGDARASRSSSGW